MIGILKLRDLPGGFFKSYGVHNVEGLFLVGEKQVV